MKRASRYGIRRASSGKLWMLRGAAVAVCAVLLAIGLAGPAAEGCGWSGYERSLRFSSSFVDKDRLPPLPGIRASEEWVDDGEYFWGYSGPETCGCGDGESDECYNRFETAQEHFAEARVFIEQGDLASARQRLEEYLDESASLIRDGIDDDYSTPQQPLRNHAIDLLDVLREHERGVSTAAVQAYATVRFREGSAMERPDAWVELTRRACRDDRIADNVAYLNGAYIYRKQRYADAAAAFDALVEAWPNSEKRDAALFMSGLSWLKCDTGPAGLRPNVPSEELLLKARDRFNRLLKLNPTGRFANDAHGWLAHVALDTDDVPSALVWYYTLLTNVTDESQRLEGVHSLGLAREYTTEEDMLEVERRLEGNPTVALAYAYYEIYNEGPVVDESSSGVDDVRTEWQRGHFERIVSFTSRMADRFPKGDVGAGFALRVAGACVELKRYDDAAKFATRALAAGPTAREQRDALLLLATAEHGAGRYDRARQAVNRLLATGPDARVEESARRRMAMICEDEYDFAGALDQYRALRYEADASYVIDVLMSIPQLQDYIHGRPNDPEIDWLRYALCVRMLRAGKYDSARVELRGVRTSSSPYDHGSWQYDWSPEDGASTVMLAKDPKGIDPKVRTPRRDWVVADSQTATDLYALQTAAIRPADDEVVAEAQYQFAAYLFDKEALLFYNPSLWWGNRTDCLKDLHFTDSYRLPGEAVLAWNATNQHDALAQSVDRFLDVVEMYPNSKAAPDALYSAAVAHERLASFNGYWSEQYAAGRHAGRRLVTYDDVRRAYPAYRIPKGTYGWEASTRTVNGGPAWDPLPPKPKPVPAWRHYAKRVPEVIAEFGGPVVTAVWGTVQTATSWIVSIVKRATILALQAILLAMILGAWISAVRSSLALALDATNGQKRARALLPASSSYRPRDHAWLAWAADRVASMRRSSASQLSIAGPSSTIDAAKAEPRLDDRLVLFIERTRLFLSTTPEGLALVLVVVTHVPILLFLAMAL